MPRIELKFCLWNIRDLASKCNDKTRENGFHRAIDKAGILLLCETWSSPNQPINIEGFQATICHQEKVHVNARRASGGIAAFIRNDLTKLVEMVKTYRDLYMWLQINLGSHHFMLSFMYIPPGSINSNNEVLNFLRNTQNEVQEPVFEKLDIDFTMKELKAAIKDLGNNKAAGQDGLVNEIFKNVVELHPAMLTLFNQILSTGHFPIQWMEGIILPIYKKGDYVCNFRFTRGPAEGF